MYGDSPHSDEVTGREEGEDMKQNLQGKTGDISHLALVELDLTQFPISINMFLNFVLLYALLF